MAPVDVIRALLSSVGYLQTTRSTAKRESLSLIMQFFQIGARTPTCDKVKSALENQMLWQFAFAELQRHPTSIHHDEASTS
ncbi:hypothetical protein Slin15195_G095730 [Septoria linicola]|uniref:Uncharacterized protein n=1 Tax=Septoria linicola TaxID=215465 RepID=A0A9Q9AVL0_9PEZI|nr:hypothetical protein Slin14017_G058820 [Septoria linicola]USW56254.1 hypothetical protein Slin15195_G095730 [Septoria linicola]